MYRYTYTQLPEWKLVTNHEFCTRCGSGAYHACCMNDRHMEPNFLEQKFLEMCESFWKCLSATVSYCHEGTMHDLSPSSVRQFSPQVPAYCTACSSQASETCTYLLGIQPHKLGKGGAPGNQDGAASFSTCMHCLQLAIVAKCFNRHSPHATGSPFSQSELLIRN